MKEKEDITIFQIVDVPIKLKDSGALVPGDVPVARYNTQTKQWERVVNKRGRAYGARNRLMHREKSKQLVSNN